VTSPGSISPLSSPVLTDHNLRTRNTNLHEIDNMLVSTNNVDTQNYLFVSTLKDDLNQRWTTRTSRKYHKQLIFTPSFKTGTMFSPEDGGSMVIRYVGTERTTWRLTCKCNEADEFTV
jgi:hypothetical protein